MFIAKLKYASVVNVNLSNELNDDYDELNVHDVIINDVNLIHDVLYVQVNEVQI
jgi:RecB family endonuclease NucS